MQQWSHRSGVQCWSHEDSGPLMGLGPSMSQCSPSAGRSCSRLKEMSKFQCQSHVLCSELVNSQQTW